MKRLKNIETNQKSNKNDKSESSTPYCSARSESSKKTSSSYDDGDETQNSFEYLEDNSDEFFNGYPNIFDSDLKQFFNHTMSEEKLYIDYDLLSNEILIPSGNAINFFKKYGYLYNFWQSLLLNHKNLNEIKLQQIDLLEDLMNSGGFEAYQNISKPKGSEYKAENLYLPLLGNSNETVGDISYLKTFKNQYNGIKGKILFDLRKEILKKPDNKKLIRNDYKESITERTKLRRQRFAEKTGEGLKILTPNQILSRLQISLAQLNAGNNSEKLKNEIRQILYSLYRSKTLTKQIYKSLINII